ncbi:Acriflavine sensitivity control protein acr-2 [Beauveria bassiana]|nr:Acriflavine sensitivity control protein acr-2 [Beauveria bassiana]KAH8708315.1 Acriflavine sensitivity control protein acr-2 [Beauveria bassiana]
MPHLLRPPLCRFEKDNGGSAASGSDERCQRAYRHALAAKHKALGIMRDAVVNIDMMIAGAVLASVFFLVDLELMESGRASWKAHLKGAGEIQSLFQPTLANAGPSADYISADYLIHICCPQEILHVLLAAATLSNTPGDASDNEQAIAAAFTLFESAYIFDVDAWARDEATFSFLRSATAQTRIYAGHAHRLAACLYILRAIAAINSL